MTPPPAPAPGPCSPRTGPPRPGGDGTGKNGVTGVARARCLTGLGFKQAATAGGGTGWSVGRGTSRSEGQDGQRRRRQGQGSGASPGRGTSRGRGSSGRRRQERVGRHVHRPGPARALGGGGAPAGQVGPPAPTQEAYPLCRICGGDQTGGGGALRTARAPRLHLPASSKPRSPPLPPLRLPRVVKAGPPGRTNTTSHPRAIPPRVPTPCIPAFRAARTLEHRPDQGDSGLSGAAPGQDARPGITGVLSRCAGRPTPPSPCVFNQVKEVQRFQERPAPAPGRRGHGDPASSARPDQPHPALPRPAGAPDRAPTCAVAADLNLRPARRRARPTGRSPCPPSPPA